MTIPDVNGLTLPELRDLISLVAEEIAEREAVAQNAEMTARQSISQARTSLESLLGPVNATAGTTSIRAVRAYGDAVIAQNSAQAVPLIVRGMEQLTRTLIEITKIIKTN